MAERRGTGDGRPCRDDMRWPYGLISVVRYCLWPLCEHQPWKALEGERLGGVLWEHPSRDGHGGCWLGTHKFDQDVLKDKFVGILKFNKEEKAKLHALLLRVACAAAQECVGAIHALDLLVKANALVWSENIPDKEHVQAHLDKFWSSKPTRTRAEVLQTNVPTIGTKQCASSSRKSITLTRTPTTQRMTSWSFEHNTQRRGWWGMHLSRQERMSFVNTAETKAHSHAWAQKQTQLRSRWQRNRAMDSFATLQGISHSFRRQDRLEGNLSAVRGLPAQDLKVDINRRNGKKEETMRAMMAKERENIWKERMRRHRSTSAMTTEGHISAST